MPYAIGNRDYFAVSTCALSTLTPKRYSVNQQRGAMLEGFVWGKSTVLKSTILAAVFASEGCSSTGSGGDSLFRLPFGRIRRSFNLPRSTG